MKLASLRILRGPNVHARRPRAVATLAFETPGEAELALAGRWRAALPVAVDAPDLAHAVARLALDLQAGAGAPPEPDDDEPLAFGRGREAVCAWSLEPLVRPALAAAVRAADAALRGESASLAEDRAALAAWAHRHATPAAWRPLLLAARDRGIPVLALGGQDAGAEPSFQFGWGSRQRRVAAPATASDATAIHGAGRIPLVAITGTNGKTTTTQLVAHALRFAGRRVGTTTTQGVWIGTRQVEAGDCTGYWSARRVLESPEVDVAVLETARGGLLKRGLAFDACDVGVVLNVASDHLGLDGVDTLDELAHAKGLVARTATRAAVLNAEDPRVAAMAGTLRPGCSATLFSLDPWHPGLQAHRARGGRCAVLAGDTLELGIGPVSRPLLHGAEIPMALGGHARHNLANALAAAAALEALGVADADIAAACRSFASDAQQNPLRSNRLVAGGVQLIVDYAHNEAACRALFASARALAGAGGRLVGVVTAPGDRRAEDLARVGAACAVDADALVVYELDPRGRAAGATARAIAYGAAQAAPGCAVSVVPQIRPALAAGLARCAPGDWLVFTCAGTLADVVAGVALHRPAWGVEVASQLDGTSAAAPD